MSGKQNRHSRISLWMVLAVAAVLSPQEGGTFTTKPLVFAGNRLEINAGTCAVGAVRGEIQDASGIPRNGVRKEDCVVFYGDEIAHAVEWKGDSDLSHLAGKLVRLRFRMNNADLYSIRFR